MAVKNPLWGTRIGMPATDFDQVVPIKDAGWTKRALFGMRSGYIRNLGVAVIDRKRYSSGRTIDEKVIVAYGHTQISNAATNGWPAMGFVLDREAAEQFLVMLVGALAVMPKP